jgi:hypothetical protein
VVTKDLVVETFGVGLAVHAQGPHCLGGVAVQVVTRRGRQVEQVEHVGSAPTDAELAFLLAAARERMSPGQDVLGLGALPVVPARMDDVADWTAEPTLPLQPSSQQVTKRLPRVRSDPSSV